jgi:hypothetical protein
MRAFLSVCAGVLFYFSSYSQPVSVIKGVMLDSMSRNALSYATINIVDTDRKTTKSTLSKDDGSFEIKINELKNIQLVISMIGYNTKTVSVNTGRTDLGKIYLAASGKALNEVVITSAKPIIKQEVDRIAYNVQNDPENKVLTVLEMLRKVPLITVDGRDNIKLQGNDNYKVLINGRESALVAKNPADVFKGMPASNIEKIEVITTPPAKYDAEGLAGIINIITKKNIDQGYNGSVNTRYHTNAGPGLNLNATVKQNKVGLSGYVGYNLQNSGATSFGNSNVISSPVKSNLSQTGTNTRNGDNLYGSAELSYEFDTLNLITATYQHYGGDNNQVFDQYSYLFNNANVEEQYYHLDNHSNAKYRGTDLGLNYQLGFKRNKEQLLTVSYKYKLSGNTQDSEGLYLERKRFEAPSFRQYNSSGNNEQTAQVDYVQPLKVFNIELGAKAIRRNNFSDFENYLLSSTMQEYRRDPLQSNSYDQNQSIYSVYNSYQIKSKKWVGKAGLRLEFTSIDLNFSSTDSPSKLNYRNLIPSLSAQRVLNDKSNITFGFSQRIQRPSIWFLNPFVDRSNPRYVKVGNPDLRPVTRQHFELKYSNFAKGSINVGLSYGFANNTVEGVLSVGADTVTTRTFQNVGKNDRLGIDASVSKTLFKNLTVNINSTLVYVFLEGTYNGKFYNNQGIQGYIFNNNTYKFGKGFTMGLNIDYDSRYVLLQGKDNDYFSVSLSGSKELLKKKATVSMSIDNPFNKYQNFDFYNGNDDFKQVENFQIFGRRFTCSFNYKFGKLNGGIKKNKRGISNDDVSGGRD